MRHIQDRAAAHGASDCTGGRALEDSDETLMRRIGAGDHQAYRQIIEVHLQPILAFAQRALGGDRAGAEDVAQETFLRLWTHAARWQPTARLGTWLHRVALNLCLDRLGRAAELGLKDIAEPADPNPSPAAYVQARDIGRHVSEALARLPAQQRLAITLCHHQGLRNTEAADVMGISVEALESLLSRGRRTLRTRLRAVLPDLLGED